MSALEKIGRVIADENTPPRHAMPLRDVTTDLAKTYAELRSIEHEMRERLMRNGSTTPTLIAWADRIASASARLA